MLRAPDDVSSTLAQALTDLKQKTHLCSICYNITEDEPCGICADSNRDSSIIAVVEEPLDVLPLERTGTFKGRYHVLDGVISPRDGLRPEESKIRQLIKAAE